MPAGHIIPPGSAQDFAQQQAALRAGQDEQKLRQGIMTMAPIYKRNTVSQLGITGLVNITGCSATVAVATRRIIRITGYAIVQQHTTKAAVQLFVNRGVTTVDQSVESIGVDDYGTMVCPAIDLSPPPGTYTYTLQLFIQPASTLDLLINEAFIFVEDAGLGPA